MRLWSIHPRHLYLSRLCVVPLTHVSSAPTQGRSLNHRGAQAEGRSARATQYLRQLCAVISKGLVSQVSSWTEVHRSMLEEVNREGKQRQSPGPHFLLDNLLGLLVLWVVVLFFPRPVLARTWTYLSSETWPNSMRCPWVKHKHLLFDHQLFEIIFEI